MPKKGGKEDNVTPKKLVKAPSADGNVVQALGVKRPVPAVAGMEAVQGNIEWQINMMDKLADSVHQGNIQHELQDAITFGKNFLTKDDALVPLGMRSPVASPAEVIARAKTTAEVLFGGALGMLDLDIRVKPMDLLDLGRMRWGIQTLQAEGQVHGVLGTVAVQAAAIQDNAVYTGLLRVERDADIDAVLLAIYWHKDCAGALSRLRTQCRDTVFSAQRCGQGLSLSLERFVRTEAEEKKRAVAGQSSWRKAIDLKAIVVQAEGERNGRSDAALAAALLADKDSMMSESWNKDTIGRYLAVASKLDKHSQDILTKWEFIFQRGTLVDGFTNLRSAASVCATPAEMTVLLETLFFEQCCKMRKAISHRGRNHQAEVSHLFRGLLLRNVFFKYLRQIFPKLADSVQSHGTWEWYHEQYRVTRSGLLEESGTHDQSDDEPGTPQNAPSDDEVQTRYMSKQKLIALMDTVAKNKHEAAFTGLARCTGTSHQLDLAVEPMKMVHAKVNEVLQLYKIDFPPEVVREGSLPEAVVATPTTAGEYSPATVKTTSAIQSEEEYATKLSQHVSECRRQEAEAIKAYVDQRIVLKICRYESNAVENKLKQITFMSEPGRKLFMYDSFCRDPLNWTTLKKKKRSYLTGAKVQMTINQPSQDDGDTLAVMKNAYSIFATGRSADNLLEDVLAVIVPGAGQDTPENGMLTAAWKSLKMTGPKHVGPKIGRITMSQQELMQQLYTRGSWNRSPDHNLVFTFQAAPPSSGGGRKRMRYLSDAGGMGDTYFNVWPVPVLPLANMVKCTVKEHDDIFLEDTAQDSGAEDGAGGAAVEDLGEQLVPFPRELHCKLTREMIHVWDIDVGVIFNPGSGQSLLAFIMENKRAVGFAKNQVHRSLIMKMLTDAVRTLGLAQHTPPPKPKELTVWESSLGQRAASKAPSGPPVVLGSHPPAPGPAAGQPQLEAVPSMGTGAARIDALPLPVQAPKAGPMSAGLATFGQTNLR